MGHYCKFCGTTQPNERFSGKGHRNHVCKKCAAMPREKRDAIEEGMEIDSILKQYYCVIACFPFMAS